MATAEADLLRLERWVTDALTVMEPAARRRLFAAIGRELRTRTRRRMTAQTGPDGERWQPRARDQARQVRSKSKMMLKLRDDRRLLLTSSPDGVDVGWSGAAARIAMVHHEGDWDYVDQENSQIRVRYPQRRLIGLAEGDLEFIRDKILTEIGRAFTRV